MSSQAEQNERSVTDRDRGHLGLDHMDHLDQQQSPARSHLRHEHPGGSHQGGSPTEGSHLVHQQAGDSHAENSHPVHSNPGDSFLGDSHPGHQKPGGGHHLPQHPEGTPHPEGNSHPGWSHPGDSHPGSTQQPGGQSHPDHLKRTPDPPLNVSSELTVVHHSHAPLHHAEQTPNLPAWSGPSKPADVADLDGSEYHVLTKLEPVDVKGEILTHLKQEYVRGTPASASASGQGPKDGQLRDLLLGGSSIKALDDDTASKTLLQLSPDLKAFGGAQLLPRPHHQRQHPSDFSFGLLGGQAGGGEVVVGLDGAPRPRKVRHKKRVNGKKICLVCGDKALAHNFDVITCESCKAFFRRNALRGQNLQRCMFQNSCTVDKNTRRFCPSCRLKKCFDIGMKAELILDDEERRLRQEKKAMRIKRQAASSSTTTDEAGEGQVGSSGANSNANANANAPDLDSSKNPFSPDAGAAASRGGSFSPPSPVRSQSGHPALQPASHPSLQPSPLPSIHTLREPVDQSPAAETQSSVFSQSSAFGASSGGPSLQPLTSPAEQSPFSSLLSQLTAAASQSPQLPGQSPGLYGAGHHPENPSGPSFSAKSPRCPGRDSSPDVRKLLHRQQPEAEEEGEGREMEGEREGEGKEQPPGRAPFVRGHRPYPPPGCAARLFKHVPREQLPSDPFMYWIVSGEERLVLANLTIAYQDVLLSLPERGLCRNVPISDTYFIHDFLNEIDDAMYKIVQFSKHIADFRLVRKEDQIAMLKSSAMQTLGMACCAAYVHERDCWLSLRGDLTLNHLRKLTNDDPYIQFGVEYCRSVKSLVKNDFTIYALVHCMILFDPRDAKIVDRQLVNQTRDKYVIMLKHYLESQYSYLYADEYFVAIQELVREMCHMAQSGNAFFKRYSSAFQPLITEMLSST